MHRSAYVDRIADTAGRRLRLDPDTYTSDTSYEVALLAAGAVVAAVESTLADDAPAMALVRPPGHHAEADRAMGFCLFNSVAVAAAAARAAGLARVAVIDYDVHHGNGTQVDVLRRPRGAVRLAPPVTPSTRGPGAAGDIGRGDGLGFTLNVPLEAGCGDADYDRAMRELVVPVVAGFDPGLILLSAGFDAHARDPLGGMQVSTAGFDAMTDHVRRLAARCCGGRLAVVTEGGYDLTALEACLDSTVARLAAGPPSPSDAIAGDTSRADRVIPAVRRALAPHWSGAALSR